MRTALFLLSGFLLLGSMGILARLFAAHASAAPAIATALFVAVWAAVTAGNMWLGVTKAGYSISEELPIFLFLFAVPAAAALFIKWRFM